MHARRLLHWPVILLLVLLGTMSTELRAQQQYGAWMDYSANSHSTDFRAFPGVPSCCPAYSDGSGGGLAFGLSAFTRVKTAGWLGLRLGMNSYSAKLIRNEELMLAGLVPGKVEHSVQAQLPTIEADLLARVDLISALSVEAGLRFGHFMNATFSQKELIVQPDSGLFENGRRSRNEYTDQSITDLGALQMGLQVGLIYSAPLNSTKTMLLQPELRFYQPFSNIVQQLNWKAQQLQFGLRLVFAPSETSAPTMRRVPERRIDTLRLPGRDTVIVFHRGIEQSLEEREELGSEVIIHDITMRRDTLFEPQRNIVQNAAPAESLQLVVQSFDRNSKLMPQPQVHIEEFKAFPAFPLLPYIFFDENSSQLPERYVAFKEESTTSFRENRLSKLELFDCYYNLLNHVGSRMITHRRAHLRLVGCNADVGAEKGNGSLSQERARAVQNYLSKVWKIPAQRVSVESRNLPAHAANVNTADGAQENRRVELVCDDPEVLAPLYDVDTMRVLGTKELRMKLNGLRVPTTRAYRVEVQQAGRSLYSTVVASGSTQTELSWILPDSLRYLRTEAGALRCQVYTDQTQPTLLASADVALDYLSIRQKRLENREDEQIARYSLMMFDVRSAEVRETNKDMLSLIRTQIEPGARVEVIGYADRSGDTKSNQQLALERAQNVAKELGLSSDAQVSGQLDSTSYDQNKPEGRLYSRMVDIIVHSNLRK